MNYNDNPEYISFLFQNDTNYENVSGEVSFHNTNHIAIVIDIALWAICSCGAMGNAAVIWFLGFRIKRNPFSTYILNLAVADFGVLLSAPFQVVELWVTFLYGLFLFLFLSTYSASQFLLMVISIDRCMAVFFPLWHRCHRPPHLSTIVCTLIWFLSLLLTSLTFTLVFQINPKRKMENFYQFFVNAMLCLRVTTMATMALFVKVCFKPRQQRRGKLVTAILLVLLFYLLFAFPMNIMFILKVSSTYFPFYILHGSMLLVCLNSSVNPALYILVGRQWKSRQKQNMKIIFQKVFKEEESQTEETPMETKL